MGEREGLLVICGTTFWSGTRLLDQHMAEHLTEYSPVLYVDPPTSLVTRFRNGEAGKAALPPGLHQVSPRLHVLSTRVPPLKERPVVKEASIALVRRSMRTAVRRLGSPAVHAMIVPSLNPYFGALRENYSVFYAKDDYLAGAGLMGIQQRRLRRRAIEQPRRADLVVAVSSVLVDVYRAQGIEAVLIPNGCDPEHFSNTAAPPTGGTPTVAFVGHLSDRVDVGLLAAVAREGVRVKLIGPAQETMRSGLFDDVLAGPNVSWLGPRAYADLPRLLDDVTTCLLPYANTPFNRASFPLKILEYLAAGRRVVATDLPAVRWLDTDLVTIAQDGSSFARSVVHSLRRPLHQDEVSVRRSFAREHAWAARARLLAEALLLADPVGIPPSEKPRTTVSPRESW